MELEELSRRLCSPTPEEAEEDRKVRELVLQIVNRPMRCSDLMRKCRISFTVARRALGAECEQEGCSKAFPDWLLPDGTSACDEHCGVPA